MQAQQNIVRAGRQQWFNAYWDNIRQLLIPLALVLGWSMLLLAGMYARPLALPHDVGAGFETMTGLYEREVNRQFSYAYTRGDATLRFPQIGTGRYIIQLRMGGPGLSALPTQLLAAELPIDLGRVQQIRNYQLLLPSDAQGTIQLRLLSGVARIDNEPRPLGVLLDRVEARSAGPALPAGALILSIMFVLGLATGTLSQRDAGYRRKVAGLLLAGTALGLIAGFSRGRVELNIWWSILLLGMFAALFVQLSRLDAGWFARPIYAVAALFCTWRALLFFLAWLGIYYGHILKPLEKLIEKENATYEAYRNLARTVLVGGWVHWDGMHYLAIADAGYQFRGQEWPNIAFFPLYPLLIRACTFLLGPDTALAGVLVAQLAFFLALLLLYQLLARDFGANVAYRSLLLLLAFPTSLFFAAAYSESLALLLLVAAVWALRRQRWWLAGAAGLLLALTRLPGVLIAPLLVIVYLQHQGWRWRAIRSPILAALLPIAGLALFMLYQWARFGTPFAFMIAQQSWKNQLSLPWVLPKELFNQIFVYGYWPMAVFQSLFWVGFIVLTVVALLRLPPLYSLTLLVFLLPPYLSSWPWSVSRHVLLGFPALVVLAQWGERIWLRQALIVAMLALLAVAMVLFVNGFLVA